ncbi:hypothetical protein [Pseudomonas sp. SDO55104_S430]
MTYEDECDGPNQKCPSGSPNLISESIAADALVALGYRRENFLFRDDIFDGARCLAAFKSITTFAAITLQ